MMSEQEKMMSEDFNMQRIDYPDPTSSLSREEQLTIVKMYNQLRPPCRQGQRPTTMLGYLRAIKRFRKSRDVQRKDLMELVSNVDDE